MLQADLVRAAGVSDATVRPVMRGTPGNYRPAKLGQIARALGWTSDSIDRILQGEEPIDASKVIGSKIELHGAAAEPLTIDLPEGTEFEKGDTVYVVITVKGGSALATQLLANAPWINDRSVGQIRLEDVDQLIANGQAFEVRIAGHDAPATVIKTHNFDREVESVVEVERALKAAAEKGKAGGARKASLRKPKPRGEQ